MRFPFPLFQIEIDLEAIEKFKEMYGIDLMEIDLDVVESRPRLDSSVQRSKAMAVNQEVSTRRLPAKVATKLGTVYPQHRKDLMKLAEDRHRYTTQQSAPVGHSRKESDEDVSDGLQTCLCCNTGCLCVCCFPSCHLNVLLIDVLFSMFIVQVRTRLGIGRGNPLAGLASVMKGGLLKKSPRSSPGSARKEPVTPPVVALKPTKKPIKAPPVKSISVDPHLTSHTKEEVKTSTPKPGEKPPEPETPPESKPPTKNVSSSQRSVRSDSGDLSTLFPRGNSHLFDDDEISQWFVKADGDLKTTTEEREEDIPPVEEKKETPTKKPPVKGSKPAIPEWKKSLQERKTLKEKETASPVKETKERAAPEKKDLFDQKDRTALEPAPLIVLSTERQPASEGKESKQVLEKESEPDLEKKSEPEPEKKSEPVPEKKPELVSEKKPELVSEKKPELVPEKKPEPVPEKKLEPVPEKKAEPVPEKKAEPVPEKKLEAEPVPDKKQDASTEQLPAGSEKTKKDEKIPEWKRRLEERRAARAKEMEDIRSAAKPKNVADWKTRKTDSAPEKKPEPVQEKKPEPAQEKKPEPVQEKKPEPVQEKKPEPVQEEKPEPVPEKQEVEVTEEQVKEIKEDKPASSVKNDVEEVIEQKVVETVEEMPPSTDKTVGGVANKEEASTEPQAPASDKKDEEKIPDWKKRLEERRAARAKERENIRPSTEAKKVPDWKTRKTEESKATKESGKKAPAVTSTDSVPEWKKQLEERRKQRELEKAQKQTEKSREHSRNVEDDIPVWKKKLAERKGERETPAKSEPSTTKSTTQPEQRKPLFDESLLKESEKPEQKPTSKEESKEKKKATIDSLFDEDDDVLFKSTTSSSPIPVIEPAERKVESPVTLDSGETPSPDIVIPEGQESNIVSDWVVVDDEAVKQANEDIAAAGKKEPSIKNEEQVSDKKTSPLLSDRKSSPLPVRRTPSPTMKGSPKQSHDAAGSPSWLDRATKMREANQSKYTRSKTSQVSSTKEDEEMPGWRKRVLERKKEKELASSRNRSPISKPKEASSSTSKSSGNESVKSEKKTEVAKTSSPIATRQSQKPTTEDDVSDWQQRLAERRKAREMEREKKLGSTTKKTEAKTSEEKPSPKEPAQEESKKATSSPFDDEDDELPSWKSKLASRKKQLEKRKDELGVPISVTASERAQSEPPHADEQETSEPLATKQEFTSSDNLLSATGSQKMTGSRISSVSSVDEVFSASENTQDTEKTSSKTSLSPTGGEEVRKSPSPHSSTEPISAEEEIPPQGCVRRTSVKFSSKESDDDLPQWKKKLLERKKSGRKEMGSDSNTSIESKKVRCVVCVHTHMHVFVHVCVVQVSVHVYAKICTVCFILFTSQEEGVPEFLKEFRRKRANSQGMCWYIQCSCWVCHVEVM